MRLHLSVSTSAPTAAASAAVAGGQAAIWVTPALTVLEGPTPGHVFRMSAPEKRAYVAGRAAESDFALSDATVSRKHARFWIEQAAREDRVQVEDLGSTNGTFVNGRKVSRQALGRGDRVCLGSVVLRFDLLDPVEVKVVEQVEASVRTARTDPLTGLETRRALGELDGPAAGLSGDGRVAAILVDLDHFKQVNDTFGHGAGDAVLKRAAVALQASLRTCDLAVRWGGEEFLALLRATEPEEALAVATRILGTLRRQDVSRFTPGRTLTASLGVACARTGETLTALIDRADRALYRAKAGGRNRCEVSAD